MSATVLETPSVISILMWHLWMGKNLGKKILICFNSSFFLFSSFLYIYLVLISQYVSKQREEIQAEPLWNQDVPDNPEVTCLLSSLSRADKVVKPEDWSQHAVMTRSKAEYDF